MSTLLLTGPPGAGKNTVAEVLARKRKLCAVIDVDIVRCMVLQPQHAPWDGEEGRRQVALGVRNTCMLANSFRAEGCDVVILDVIDDETFALYQPRSSLRWRCFCHRFPKQRGGTNRELNRKYSKTGASYNFTTNYRGSPATTYCWTIPELLPENAATQLDELMPFGGL